MIHSTGYGTMDCMDAVMILFKVAGKFGVSSSLMLAVCLHESGLKDVHNYQDGGSASYGMCQIKLGTAQGVGRIFGHKDMESWTSKDMHEPEKNIKAAAMYLSYIQAKHDGNVCAVLAEYNAGRVTESKVEPGLPRNYKYVKKVAALMGIERVGDECRKFFNKRKNEQRDTTNTTGKDARNELRTAAK